MKYILAFSLLVLFALSGCTASEAEENLQKCTIVCAEIAGEDFTTLDLCVTECEQQFLGSEEVI